MIQLKGSVIAESVASSRRAPKPAPNFLHLDDGCVVDENHELKSIGGAPLEPDKLYTVAIYQFLLTGLNVIEPLLSYVQQNVAVPDLEVCRPVKDIIMETCIKDAWRQLVGYEQFDVDGDGDISADELEAGVDRAVAGMDTNNDGRISKSELAAYLTEKGSSHALLQKMIDILDVDCDGEISRAELKALAH